MSRLSLNIMISWLYFLFIELLEEALMDEEQEGPLCDLFFFFLSNLFRIHIEEEGEKWFQFEPGDSGISRS